MDTGQQNIRKIEGQKSQPQYQEFWNLSTKIFIIQSEETESNGYYLKIFVIVIFIHEFGFL